MKAHIAKCTEVCSCGEDPAKGIKLEVDEFHNEPLRISDKFHLSTTQQHVDSHFVKTGRNLKDLIDTA